MNIKEKLKKVEYPSAGAHVVFWSIVVVGAAADLWSKWAVFKWLRTVEHNQYTVIDGFFNMVMRVNRGAAFSIAYGHRWPLVTVSIIAFVVVICIFIFGNIRQRIMQVSLGLFTAGIIGNLYDRLFNNGEVRDFLDFHVGGYHWPAFNIADSMLCVAVGLMVISSFRQETAVKSKQ